MAARVMRFQEVYDAHFGFVWRSLRSLGVGEAELPDAVQEVFLVVHQKLAEFEGRSKVTTWLFAIAMRVASTRRRTASVRREVPAGDQILGVESGTADAAAELERREAAELFEAIMERLPIEQRMVFMLFEVDGRSGDEIAELLGIPRGTVHSRLRLARAAFREHVERHRARERSRMRSVGES
jgi:RNA polymerase sigma-70 factor (ECF subfamily)